jgi:N-acetylglucosaminyldiphosphoundecaprenol N-acetyl-beta-D-mannosaminyltransferase
VNNVMEAYDSKQFRLVMNDADLVTPDGMPLVWGLRLLGLRQAVRVYGPDLTPILLDAARRNSVRVGFYGGSPEVLRTLVEKARMSFPGIDIGYAYSPPFRPLPPEEESVVVDDINASGVRLLFIGLNSPKQDVWMARHRQRLQTVMIGVGAAFDLFAGSKPQAPRWMMAVGLEWLFRLTTEPRRLWRRYLRHNPRFVVLFIAQLLGLRRFTGEDSPSPSAEPV